MSNILTATLPEELRILDLDIKPVLGWTYVTKQDLSITSKSTGSILENDKLPELHKTSPINPYYDNLSIKSLIPSQLAAFYGFNRVANQGQGQTIYIINAYGNPNYQADLNKFCTQFNLPQTTVPNYFVGGIPNWSTVAPADSARWLSWAYETNLNIQYAHAMAPSATKVLITCLDENWLFDGIFASMVQLSAKIFSCSWGAVESPTLASQFSAINDVVFKDKPAIFCIASGNTSGVVSYPSSSPDVISVGGSELNGGSASNYWVSAGPIRETTWLNAGSGPSVIFPQPNYQTNFTPATAGRFTPDISYNAGAAVPVYITQPTLSGSAGWGYFMGTSCAAPQIAAFIARQYSAGLLSTVNSRIIQQTLYSLASSAQSYYFNDITTGNNVVYSASVGYDSATGLGSPAVANIINLVTGATPTPTITRTSTPTPTITRTSTPTPTRTPTRTRGNLITTPVPTASGVFVTPTPTVTRTRNLSGAITTPIPTLSGIFITPTPTITVTRTLSSGFNVTPTSTPTITRTSTPTVTRTSTPTVTITRGLSGGSNITPTPTPTPSSTRTPSLSGLTTSLSVRLGDGTTTATLNFVNGLLVSIV